MGTSTEVATHGRIDIGGEWTSSDSDRTIDVVNAATEEVIARVPDGTASDVDRAVDAKAAQYLRGQPLGGREPRRLAEARCAELE